MTVLFLLSLKQLRFPIQCWSEVVITGIFYLLLIWDMFAVVVQSFSYVQLFATPWTAARQASLSITNSSSLLKLMSFESMMPSNHLILRHPLLLPSIFPSVRVFCNESVFSISQNIWYKFLQITFIKLVIIKLVSFSTVLIFLKNFVVNGCWILFNIFPSSTEKIVCFS